MWYEYGFQGGTMYRTRIAVIVLLLSVFAFAQDSKPFEEHDWSGVQKYRDTKVPPTKGGPRVVLIGASLVERWDLSKTFPAGNYINRGIDGQGTSQMLLRFYQDVVMLSPRVVVIFPGVNELGGAFGKVPVVDIQHNLAAMAQLAKANGIRVIFASILPMDPNGSHPYVKTVTSDQIREINRWMFQYAKDHGDTYADLWSPLGDSKYNLMAQYSVDGVHINDEGYKVLGPVLEKRVAEALAKPSGRMKTKADFDTED